MNHYELADWDGDCGGGEGEAGETYTTNAKLEEDAGSKKIKK